MNLELGKPKAHINYIKENDKELFSIITRMYTENNLDVQFEMLKKCSKHMSASIGGPWKKDEALFHIIPDGNINYREQETVAKLLFQ